MGKHTIYLAGFAALFFAATAAAQSLTTGPAPAGDAAKVASKVIKDAEHPCPKVSSATRVKDGSITAKCTNGESYRVFTIKAKPYAMKCSAAKALGIAGC